MSVCDTARLAYESSRNEILERIRLRDNALLAFLGATGVVFGVATGTSPRPQLLLILPYLSLAAAFIVTQHDRTIGRICAFLTEELDPFLREHAEAAPTWEACSFLQSYSSAAMILRSTSHSILIILPAAVALVWSWPVAKAAVVLEIIWWCAVVITTISSGFLFSTHRERRRYYHSTSWRTLSART